MLRPSGEDVVIISHSLAKIAGYSLMLRLEYEMKANLFFTAGFQIGVSTLSLLINTFSGTTNQNIA